jgi:DNA (cytosine-5)-methyltransferase 1
MRVYDPEGTSCTLSAQGGGMGAKTGLYTITKSGVHNLGSVTAYKNDYTVHASGIARTLMACAYKHVPQVYIENQSNTLTTSDNLGVLVDKQPIRIRKLTPKECWRLQGFSDAQYEKAAAVNSNSQLYKQAGNAVTVNVVEEIGRHIMSVEHEDRGINK